MFTNNPAICAEHLGVTRGGHDVLHDLHFTIPRGQITGLLGPSGCGKSTLMRAIVGVQSHVKGSLDILGHPAGSKVLRHRIGYMTQAASVYNDLTVEENLRFFAGVQGVAKNDVDRVLRDVDLYDRRSQVVQGMSGGQRSRVSLAASLLGDPDILVLDEPTVGLDPVLRQSLWKLFADIAARGCTILVSSHVMDEAEHADKLLLLRDGELIADSSPQELKQKTGCTDIESAFLEIIR